jgi:hypothetical protein
VSVLPSIRDRGATLRSHALAFPRPRAAAVWKH